MFNQGCLNSLFVSVSQTILREFEEEKSGDEDVPEDFVDLVEAGNDFFFFTTGSNKEFVIRSYDEEEFRQEVSPPHDFQILRLSPNGKKVVAFCMVMQGKGKFKAKKPCMCVMDSYTGKLSKKYDSRMQQPVFDWYKGTVVKSEGNFFVWWNSKQVNFWNIDNGKEKMTLDLVSLY